MTQLVTAVDVSTLQKQLELILSETQNKKVLDEASAFLLNRIRQRFLEEKDPEGHKWIPSQAGLRRRKSGGTGTLFKTGRLFHSIQASPVEPGATETQIGTDVWYGRMHQEGLFGNVKRVFLGVSEDDGDLYAKLLALRIQQALSGAA